MTDARPPKRSSALSPEVIGLAAVTGIGGFAIVDAMGLAGRPCTERVIATSVSECQVRAPGFSGCATSALAAGEPLGLTRSGGGWIPTALLLAADGRYYAPGATQPFTPQGACRSSSRSWGYWGYGSSSSSAASSTQSPSAASRGGFGASAQAFSGHSSGS